MAEVEGTEVEVEVEETEAPAEELTPDQLRAALTKARREAAAKRVENKTLKAAADELQVIKDSQKTEYEKLVERAERAEAEANAARHERLARSVAKEAGLDPDLAEFLKGSTEDELRASAEKLKSKAGSPKPAAPDLLGGSRGTPVRAGNDNAAAFRNMFK